MKKRTIRALWITATGILVPIIYSAVMAGLAKLPPDIVKPEVAGQVASLVCGLFTTIASGWLAHWLGIPVKELQTWLVSEDLYEGAPTGIVGERTLEGIKSAVNDGRIIIQAPPGKIANLNTVERAKRILGSKM